MSDPPRFFDRGVAAESRALRVEVERLQRENDRLRREPPDLEPYNAQRARADALERKVATYREALERIRDNPVSISNIEERRIARETLNQEEGK